MVFANAGSTFTAGTSGLLTSIDIPIFGVYTPVDLTVRVFLMSGGQPSGAALATSVIPAASLPAFPSLTTTNVAVPFTNPATVVRGTTYAFLMNFESCTNYSFASIGWGPAPADKRVINVDSNGTWSIDSAKGINFTTYVETPAVQTSSSVPPPTVSVEPLLASTGQPTQLLFALVSGLVSLVAGVAAIFFVRRKRHTAML